MPKRCPSVRRLLSRQDMPSLKQSRHLIPMKPRHLQPNQPSLGRCLRDDSLGFLAMLESQDGVLDICRCVRLSRVKGNIKTGPGFPFAWLACKGPGTNFMQPQQVILMDSG